MYKYISSKEEIYLLVALDELQGWVADLKQTFDQDLSGDIDSFSQQWAEAADRHPRFLKWISMLFTIIERNVTLEKLVDFKKQYIVAIVELGEVM